MVARDAVSVGHKAKKRAPFHPDPFGKTRDGLESKFATALRRSFARQYPLVRKALLQQKYELLAAQADWQKRQTGIASKAGDTYGIKIDWNQETEYMLLDLQEALAVLPNAAKVEIAGLYSQLGGGINWTQYNVQAAAKASQYSYNLVSAISAGSNKMLGQAIGDWIAKGAAFPDLVESVWRIFPGSAFPNQRDRAALIAATETTRVFAETQADILQAAGLQEMHWRTAFDELVCPICAPMGAAEMGEGAKGNPASRLFLSPATGAALSIPAHPGCRCWAVASPSELEALAEQAPPPPKEWAPPEGAQSWKSLKWKEKEVLYKNALGKVKGQLEPGMNPGDLEYYVPAPDGKKITLYYKSPQGHVIVIDLNVPPGGTVEKWLYDKHGIGTPPAPKPAPVLAPEPEFETAYIVTEGDLALTDFVYVVDDLFTPAVKADPKLASGFLQSIEVNPTGTKARLTIGLPNLETSIVVVDLPPGSKAATALKKYEVFKPDLVEFAWANMTYKQQGMLLDDAFGGVMPAGKEISRVKYQPPAPDAQEGYIDISFSDGDEWTVVLGLDTDTWVLGKQALAAQAKQAPAPAEIKIKWSALQGYEETATFQALFAQGDELNELWMGTISGIEDITIIDGGKKLTIHYYAYDEPGLKTYVYQVKPNTAQAHWVEDTAKAHAQLQAVLKDTAAPDAVMNVQSLSDADKMLLKKAVNSSPESDYLPLIQEIHQISLTDGGQTMIVSYQSEAGFQETMILPVKPKTPLHKWVDENWQPNATAVQAPPPASAPAWTVVTGIESNVLDWEHLDFDKMPIYSEELLRPNLKQIGPVVSSEYGTSLKTITFPDDGSTAILEFESPTHVKTQIKVPVPPGGKVAAELGAAKPKAPAPTVPDGFVPVTYNAVADYMHETGFGDVTYGLVKGNVELMPTHYKITPEGETEWHWTPGKTLQMADLGYAVDPPTPPAPIKLKAPAKPKAPAAALTPAKNLDGVEMITDAKTEYEPPGPWDGELYEVTPKDAEAYLFSAEPGDPQPTHYSKDKDTGKITWWHKPATGAAAPKPPTFAWDDLDDEQLNNIASDVAGTTLANMPKFKQVEFSLDGKYATVTLVNDKKVTLSIPPKSATGKWAKAAVAAAKKAAKPAPAKKPASAKPKAPTAAPTPVVAPPKPPPPAAPAPPKPKPGQPFPLDPNTLVDHGSMGLAGVHTKSVLVDPDGNKWLFKPNDEFRAYGDQVAADLAFALDHGAAETYVVTYKGSKGSIQKMFAIDGDLTSRDVLSLPADDLRAIQKEGIFDWLIGNHDGHDANLVYHKGRLVGIDKGSLFRFYDKDRLHWDYNPLSSGTHNKLLSAYVNGADIPLAGYSDDPTLSAFLDKIQKLDDEEFKSILRPYAERAHKARIGGKSALAYQDVDKFLDAAVKRKNNIRKDFDALWKQANDERFKRTGKGPYVAPKPAVQAPKPERRPTVTGILTPVDEDLVQEIQRSKWQGKTILFGGEDVENMTGLTYHVEGYGTVIDFKIRASAETKLLAALGDVPHAPMGANAVTPDDPYWLQVEKVAKSYNYHLNSALTSFDGQLPPHTIDSIKALHDQFAFAPASDAHAAHYKEYIDKLYQEIAAGPGPGGMAGVLVKKYVPPAPKPAPKPRREAGQLVAQQTTAKTLSVRNDKGRLVSLDGEEQFPGKGITISLDDEIEAHYILHADGNRNIYTKQGRMQVRIKGDLTQEKLDRALSALERIGVTSRLATDADLELLYLQKVTSMHKVKPTTIGVRSDMTTEKKIQKYKEYWQSRLGVDDLAKLPSYDFRPTFDSAAHTIGGGGGEYGIPHWKRFDFTQAELDALLPGYYLNHTFYDDTALHGLSLILEHNGSLVGTEEKHRLGIKKGGMSPEKDQETGGSIFAFTRLKDESISRREGHLVFHKDLLLDPDVLVFGRDAYGQTSEGFAERYSVTHLPSEYKSVSLVGNNEVDIPRSISLKDHLEFINCQDESERTAVLALLRRYQIYDFRGKPIDQVVRVKSYRY